MQPRRSSRQRTLFIWMNGQAVGTWHMGATGETLQYDALWMSAPQGRPLSLSLPFKPDDRPHAGAAVNAYFDNLLPDSRAIRERLARRYQTPSTSAFDLLAEVGRDCVGAIQITPTDRLDSPVDTIDASPLNEAQVAQLLRQTSTPLTHAQESDPYDEFRISMAGAQEKTALLWHQGQWWLPKGATPTTHILKLPMGLVGNTALDLRDSVDNEWLCAQILHAYGLPVATCHPLVFEDQRVLGVARFDRQMAPNGQWIMRLPQEDFCQATGTPPHLKYEADGGPGMQTILRLLQGSAQRTTDRATFFKAQLLFWLLCAPDGHAKNFSLALQAGGSYRLTPLYDVMSAYPLLGKGSGRLDAKRVKLAMAVRGQNAHWRMQEILPRHWLALGQKEGVLTPDGQGADALIHDLIQQTPSVLASVQTQLSQLPFHLPNRVAEPVLTGLEKAVKRLATAFSR